MNKPHHNETPGIIASDVSTTGVSTKRKRKPPTKNYKYEGDGLVEILDAQSDLGRLVRCYRIEGGIDGPFWTTKLLRHILTKERIKNELQRPEYGLNESQVDVYVDQIHPESERSSPQVYLKIFALLVLVERHLDISNFIAEKFCDQMLPIAIDDLDVYCLNDQEKNIGCFNGWKITEKENFELNQWKVDTPYFGTAKDQSLIEIHLWPDTRKPWRTTPNHGDKPELETEDNEGAYGIVARSDIHPTAHSYDKLLIGINLDSTTFAIKTMVRMDENTMKTFKTEWDMLKRFSGRAHPHLVTALSAFRQDGKLSFIFPNASCALDQYMVASNPPKNRTGVLWFSSQMCGLMGALDTIHDPKHLHLEQGVIRKYGRHGDIKCDNILCFQKSGTTNEKILVISDFGLSAFNSDKSRSNIPNGKVPPVPGYRPPECDIEGGTVSRAFDIWTLGCLFLDFVTWFLGGHGYLAEFKRKRKTPFINGAVNDIFFTIKSLEKKKMEEKATYVALVKPEVTEWILTLRQHPNCSPFLHKALDLIEQDMLIVLSTEKKRSLSSKLLDDFEEISRRCQSQKGYVKGKPWGNDELRDARERMAQNITAVEIVPNETALALIRDHNRLPVHSGKSMKSIGPAQYKALERPEK